MIEVRLGSRVLQPRRQLLANGERVPLGRRALDIASVLAEANGGIVTKDELLEAIWPGVFVEENALQVHIGALRKALGPEADRLKTIRGVGYKLELDEVAAEDGGDVHPHLPATPEVDGAPVGASSPPSSSWRRWSIYGAVAAIVIAIGLWWLSTGLMDRHNSTPVTMAVLPFQNLSSNTPYFAEGVSDEIAAQLSREPQFRVIGRMSSRQLGDKPVKEIGRQLNVDYVLGGSVREQAGRVRVTAELVRASDGFQLWSNNFDGRLDDIFSIQQRVGEGIATALQRRLVGLPVAAATRTDNGEVYWRYLAARGLLRTRDENVTGAAVQLLREAVKLDPAYAPAWSSLAQAMRFDADNRGHEAVIATLPEARRYAQHALELAPDLAEAHAVLGMLLQYGSPDALAHLRRSAELDPNNAEHLSWLAHAQSMSGEYEQELASNLRAHSLDPLWFRPTRDVVLNLAEFGERARAEALIRKASTSPANLQQMLGRIAATSGDYSEAVRRSTMAGRMDSGQVGRSAKLNVIAIRYALGLPTEPPLRDWVIPADQRYPIQRVWMDNPPSAVEWRKRNRTRLASEVYQLPNLVAAKLMLNAGRARELGTTFASDAGLLGIHRNEPVRAHDLAVVPIVAIALRQSGQPQEADRLLREADTVIRSVEGKGRVPFWFDADVAGVLAAQGRVNESLSMLERAVGRSWVHGGTTDLPKLGDEPAFANLRGNPRFQHILTELDAHMQRERREIAKLKI